MLKKLSVLALTSLLTLPVSALAAAPTVQDLQQKMMDMTQNFNAQMQAMQKEISALKSKNADISKDVADVKSAAGTAGAADWTKKISLGGQVRFRGYDLQNVWNFDNSKDWDHWNVFRLKGSLKATVKATKDVTAVVQLTDQTYGEGVGLQTFTNTAGTNKTIDTASDNLGNKVFLDNAYINARNMFGLPVDLTLGRQNLIYGSGFVILDGQSQFASTSIYFDGVKLRWHATKKTSVDLLYMKDQEGNRDDASNDDITLSGAYLISKQCPLIGKSEAYILNRNDEGKKKSIWMYGLRLSDKLANGIDYSAEGAIQRGDASATQSQDAYGYKLNAGYTFKNAAMTPRLYLGYAFMSGDDTNTAGDNEGWDVFYGGWPQFGDLLVWTYVNIGPGNALNGVYNYNKLSSTGGEAVYSNLGIATLGASVNLLQNLNANLSYSKVTFAQVAAGMSDDFGDYYQAKLKYKYNRQLSFSLYGALLAPGDAFNKTPKDDATEVYWESDFRF